MPPGEAPSPAPTASPDNGADLPTVTSPLSAIEIISALDSAARRGKLPGFHKGDAQVLFRITDFGTPFESKLDAQATPHGPGGSELRFSIKIKPAMPAVLIAILLLTVWPGIWLTQSMLRAYFPSYAYSIWGTCVWYLPLTVPFVPIVTLQALRRSRKTARASALEIIVKIRDLVGPSAASPPARAA